MGYTTDFEGTVTVTPPLNDSERAYLSKFAETRRMDRANGPYFVGGSGDWGQGRDADIHDYNRPAEGQPGLRCQWVPTEDGSGIEWDGGEKFYESAAWMRYLIDHFLRPGAHAQGHEGFEGFTFDHVATGVIYAQGEESNDTWELIVDDNSVTTHDVYAEDEVA